VDIVEKSPLDPQKSQVHLQKSPVPKYLQDGQDDSIDVQKSPVYLQKSLVDPQKSPVHPPNLQNTCETVEMTFAKRAL